MALPDGLIPVIDDLDIIFRDDDGRDPEEIDGEISEEKWDEIMEERRATW